MAPMNTWSDLSAPVQTFVSGVVLMAASVAFGLALAELVIWSL